MKLKESKKNSDRPTFGELLMGIWNFGKKGEVADVDDNYIDFNDGTVDMDELTKAWNTVDANAAKYTVISKEEHTKKSIQPRKNNNYQRPVNSRNVDNKQKDHGEIGDE